MSAYRTWGVIIAILSAMALVAVIYITFGPEDVVVPETSFQASGDTARAGTILQKRTSMQRWREASGPSPSAEAPDAAVGPGESLQTVESVDVPQELVQQWRTPEIDTSFLQSSQHIDGVTSVPYAQADNLEQPGGRDWRRVHNDQVRYGGGWLIFGVLLALALFLAFRGRIPLAEGYSGERIERFNATERANHWMTATSFILMALTGLVILYGKPLLLPLIGHAAMGSLGRWSAWLHMAFAVPFVIGIFVMIALWLVANLPDRYDWPWLKRFGGFLNDSGDNPPADRFNTGQKIVFWGVVLGGLALLASGLMLMFPFFWAGYDGMQFAQLAHGIIGLLMIALIFGHIYIGTVGMQDAFSAMWSGKVDRNWLKEHHSVWFRKITDNGQKRIGRAD